MKTIFTTIAVLSLVAGCATPPDQIAPAYVSPAMFGAMSCPALRVEAARTNARLFQADTIFDALALATAEADKIVAATKRTVGVFPICDVRIPNAAPAQSTALAWQVSE